MRGNRQTEDRVTLFTDRGWEFVSIRRGGVSRETSRESTRPDERDHRFQLDPTRSAGPTRDACETGGAEGSGVRRWGAGAAGRFT